MSLLVHLVNSDVETIKLCGRPTDLVYGLNKDTCECVSEYHFAQLLMQQYQVALFLSNGIMLSIILFYQCYNF